MIKKKRTGTTKYRDIEESQSNQEAHSRARYQEREDDNRLRDQVMDPDEEGCRMESHETRQ